MLTRRRLPLLAASVGVLVLATAAAAAPNSFTAALAPAFVKPATTASYTLTLANASSSDEVERVKIAIPAGFTDVEGVTANATSAAGCTASTWEPDGTLIADGKINLRRPSGGGNRNLCPGATLTIAFTATSPAEDGTYTWTPDLLAEDDDAEPFTFTGDPTVRVDGTPPTVAIEQTPSNPTNSRSASFAFSASDPTECKLDNGSFDACTSPKSYSDLADGPHMFTLRATDAAGNSSEASFSWTVDTAPPSVSITASPPALTNSRSASFTFTASAPTQCKLDDGTFEACTSPKSYSNLADGPHTFTVKATDGAGNTSEASGSWTVDATPPTISITSGPPPLTNSRSASFTFTASEPTQCKLDDGPFDDCTSPKAYGGLADGPHTFTVRATDAAGNTAQTSRAWTIDATPPTVEITGDKPGNPTNSKTATFMFTASEPAQCSLDGAVFAVCTSPKSYSGLTDGPHTFSVKATDAAGNSAQDSYAWTIDSAAPTVTITGRPTNPTKSRSASFTFTTSEPAQCSLDGAPFSPCASPIAYSDLPDGRHVFVVRASDAAGNTGEDVYEWRIDNVAPTVVITQKPNDPSDVKSPTFAFSINEPAGVQCQLDNGAFTNCSSPVTYTNVADGQHIFTVRATDGAGNAGQAQHAWRLETRLPVATLTNWPRNPSTSTSARFEFTSRTPTFECTLDGQTDVSCASPKVYSNLAQGPHTFTVRAKDAAGIGPATSYSWVIDSVGPTAVVTQAPPNPTSNRSATFAFSANETAFFACELDGGGFGPCASPLTYHGLGDGVHTFTVRPTDVLGNPGVPAAYSWRVDGAAPETTISSAPAARTTSASATFSFSASEPAAFECKLDGGPFAACSAPKSYASLTRATHTFEVRAIDGAGNVDPTPAIHRWTVAAPAATRTTRRASALLSPRAGARVTKPPLLRWRRVRRATYYNVQLFRGSVKVSSSWPRATRLQLRARWRYGGRQRRLTAGRYRWYVWPGYGKPSLRRYGRMLGGSTFTVTRQVRR